jgi:anti-sigma factor RsiW
MTATVDGELSARQQRAFEGHLSGCVACRDELAATERMLAALDALPMETEVSALLEQETLRRVRIEAAEEVERAASRRWWTRLRVPAVAVAALAAIVFVVVGQEERLQRATEVAQVRTVPDSPPPASVARAKSPKAEESEEHVAAAPAPPAVEEPQPRVATVPPPELAARPDLFVELPILRNLEKLENFEQIETTTVDGQPRSDVDAGSRRG